MAASRVDRVFAAHLLRPPPTACVRLSSGARARPRPVSRPRLCTPRTFSASATRGAEHNNHRKESFSSRLRAALGRTKITWYPIPVGLGIAFLGAAQFYRVQRRESERARREKAEDDGYAGDDEPGRGRPKRRTRIRPSGPWQVQIMSTLPLKAISRIWGRFNELVIPYYLRVPGFKLYSFIFGVNLDEISEPDLHVYPNLASFFYRTLKPGVRPLDPDPKAVLSPADGKVIQYGMIQGREVEQVKGVTYSLDALLGAQRPTPVSSRASSPSPDNTTEEDHGHSGDEEVINADMEFARLNGLSYTLPNLFSGPVDDDRPKLSPEDQSIEATPASESEVRADMSLSDSDRMPWWAPARSSSTKPTTLYYIVVYLAPGDYHRFHSPVSWVVSQRRHFAGELYSVSPYLQRTLPGLFTLNERVVLLGRWRWGFFSYTPVGATNVGSIKINFDRELRTNSLTTDTAADRAAEQAAERGEPYSGFAEATYESSSTLLGGHALRRGEEMGGFALGSTIVLVFEAPKGTRRSFDDGSAAGRRGGGWEWCVEKGQKVKVGQKLGRVLEEDAA